MALPGLRGTQTGNPDPMTPYFLQLTIIGWELCRAAFAPQSAQFSVGAQSVVNVIDNAWKQGAERWPSISFA